MIAIGGGVCLDVAGLTANLYRRNTPVIKVRLGDILRFVLLVCPASVSVLPFSHYLEPAQHLVGLSRLSLCPAKALSDS